LFMGFFGKIWGKITDFLLWLLITGFLIVLTPIILGVLAFIFIIISLFIIIVFIFVIFVILFLVLFGNEKTLKTLQKEIDDW